MAFLDNSGDIILDAVLTDTGRFRLAQGNGSFRIAKFALGDDEIDYSLYNKNASGGSAYYDLDILQLPVLEAFTNNASSLKSKLMTITRTNLLYLPVMKLNPTTTSPHAVNSSTNIHLLAVTTATETSFSQKTGIIKGATKGGNFIRIDQGIDSSDLPANEQIPSDLNETQYIIEVDDRLIKVINPRTTDTNQLSPSFIDDDQMAVYNVNINANPNLVVQLAPKDSSGNEPTTNNTNGATPVVAGWRGTKLEFSLAANINLASTDFLFNTLGDVTTIDSVPLVKYIDTNIRITGATTGYRLDVPVRLIKV